MAVEASGSCLKNAPQAFEETDMTILELPNDNEAQILKLPEAASAWLAISLQELQEQEHMQEALERVQRGPQIALVTE